MRPAGGTPPDPWMLYTGLADEIRNAIGTASAPVSAVRLVLEDHKSQLALAQRVVDVLVADSKA